MITYEECILLGNITKKQGFENKVVILGNAHSLKANSLPESVFISIDGKLIPFCIYSAEQQSKKSLIVRFMDISDQLIERILKKDVYVLKNEIEISVEKAGIADINGFDVYDKNLGLIGKAVQLIEREIQPILIVLSKNTEVMIPWTDEIIIRTDFKRKRIDAIIPDGLLDLYLKA